MPMSRNRPPDSNRLLRPGSARKIDTPVLVVSMLTAFFATLFATLLLLRPESSDPTESIPADPRFTQSTPRVNTPPVNAPPPDPIPKAEPKPEREPNPTLQTQLKQLGIKCAKDANCYPN